MKRQWPCTRIEMIEHLQDAGGTYSICLKANQCPDAQIGCANCFRLAADDGRLPHEVAGDIKNFGRMH